MVTFNFGGNKTGSKKVLCLGAHSDDIEIGCGGSILRLIAENPDLQVYWVVLGANKPARAEEAQASAELILDGVKEKTIAIKGFRDSYFPYIGDEIKDYFESLKKEFSPDLIFTHYRKDLHQDHQLVSELTWNTYRDHLILEYEIPKYDGDLGSPNLFFHLDRPTCQKKVDHLMRCFKTQRDRFWFTEDTFWGLARIRGVESRAPDSFAEGFYCRKIVI
jgi:LmbE family N-acetylglucosaminyl deacetylase